MHHPHVRAELIRKIQTLLIDYYDDYEMPARLYTLLALISLGLDMISFFAVFGQLASFIGSAEEDGGADDEIDGAVFDLLLTKANPFLGRIIVIMLYTMCDLLFILWIIHFRSRMGQTERGYVHKALLGFGNEMRIAFGVNPKGGRPEAPPK